MLHLRLLRTTLRLRRAALGLLLAGGGAGTLIAAPSISGLPGSATIDAGTAPVFNFTVTPGAGGTGLAISAASFNTGIIPNANISTSLAGNNGSLTVTAGNPGNPGVAAALVRVSATDSTGGPAIADIVITVNRRPTLTSMNQIPGGVEDETMTIHFNDLQSRGDEDDLDGGSLQFRLESITSGSMNVAPGALMGTGGSWTWRPADNQNGDIPAFKVQAWDGRLLSSTPVPVTVNVASVPDTPAIDGAVNGTDINAAIPDSGPATIFQNITVLDADDDMPNAETVTIWVAVNDQGTFIEDNGWARFSPTLIRYGPARPADATARLRALQFAPNRNAMPVGEKVRFRASVQVEDSTSRMVTRDWDPYLESINDPPQLSVWFAPNPVNDNVTGTPFRLSIADPDVGETFTVTLAEVAPTRGTLTVPAGMDGSQGSVEFKVTQTSFRPNPLSGSNQNATFRYSVTDRHPSGQQGTAVTQDAVLTIQFINDPPEIAAVLLDLLRTTDDPQAPPAFPFPTIRITDPDPDQTLTLNLILDDPAKGLFYYTGLPESTAPVSSKTAAAAELTEWLRQVKFVPTPNRIPEGETETATVTVEVVDSSGPVRNSQTRIAVTSVNGAPELKWNYSPATPNEPFPDSGHPEPIPLPPASKPFEKVSIFDDGDVTVTVSMDAAGKGQLTSLNGFSEVPANSRRYQYTGTPANAQAKLRGLIFEPSSSYQFPPNAPGRTNFTIEVSDAVSNRTTRVLPVVLLNQSRNWLVTSDLDDAALPGTLRFAVARAASNDAITFALPQYPAVIRLRSGQPITVSKHLSIKGPGANSLTISGDFNQNGQTDDQDTQLFRVFASVSIEGITFSRGYGETGGGFFVGKDPDAPVDPADPNRPPGSLTLRQCAVTDCRAEQWGGAIDVVEGGLTLTQCLLRGNTLNAASGLGGGAVSLYTSQPCSFSNTTFSGNRQNSSGGVGGGALYAENFDPASVFESRIAHCTFAENVDASQHGSSVHANVFNTRVLIQSSIFADSTVGTPTSRNLYVTGGGAILSNGCNLSSDLTSTYLIQGGVPQLVKLLNQSTDGTGVDPGIVLPLAAGVGPTAAYALAANSPAINRCVLPPAPPCPAVGESPEPDTRIVLDQHGVLRDANPDTGAVERGSTARIVINEIFPATAPGTTQFLEFYVPANSTTFNLANYEVWVDGVFRHQFPATTIQPGFGLILADAVIPANDSPVQTPTSGPLGLKPRSVVELCLAPQPCPGYMGKLKGPVFQTISYVDVFVDTDNPDLTVNLAFNPLNSLSLVPQFGGSAFIPSSLAKNPPLSGVTPPGDPPNGPNLPTSPGLDNGNTKFGQSNANPLAVADSYLINEDNDTVFTVLDNDLDANGLDLLYVIDVSTASSGAPPAGSDATAVSALNASVAVQPAASPLRGTSIKFDPRTAHNHLSAGAQAFDSFFYTIVDIGAGPIDSYAADGGATRIVSPSHRLASNESITISGSGNAAYNGTFLVTVTSLDSFTIPVAFSTDPGAGARGSWKTTGTRTPTLASEKQVSVTVLGANDAPTPAPNAVATTEDSVLRILGDTDKLGQVLSFDTDSSYPTPRLVSGVALLADDTDPDDDDNPAVVGTYKRLKLVGVGQAYPVTNYAGTAGSSPVTVTAAGHGLASGTTVLISGYSGHPAYNGYHAVTVVDANSFTIPVTYVDNAATKGVWGILNNENRLETTSVRGAEVRLEIRANRAETNIVYNPRTSAYLNGLAKDEVDATDSFWYAVEDSHAAVSFAKVSVTVTGVNDDPVPGNDPPGLAGVQTLPGVVDLGAALAGSIVDYCLPSAAGGGKKDASISVNGTPYLLQNLCATTEDAALPILTSLLLSNDTDVDKTHPAFADVLRVQLGAGQLVSREGAAISISGPTLTYDPRGASRLNALAREESVIDTFTVTIFDGTASIPSVVAVLVTGVNDTPVAAPDTATIPEDQLLTLGPPGVLLNDSDADQNTRIPDNKKILLPVSDAGTTVFGTAVDTLFATGQGSVNLYEPVAGNPGRTLVKSTAHGLQTGEEVVISGSGFAAFNGQFPVARVDADSFSIPVAFDPAGASSGGGWFSVRSTLTYDPRASLFSFTGSGHTPAFTLDGLAQGQSYLDTYTYTMLDGSMIFANDDLYRIEADRESIELKVLTNDANLIGVGGTLKIVGVGSPNRGGSAVLNGTTSIIYTPETGFVGDEVFTYTVEDELGNRDQALVTARVTIMQLNGNLQANADFFTAAAGQAPLLDVLANDDVVPAGSIPLSVARISTLPNHGGSAVVEGGQIRYTPAGGGAPYTETFAYEISAGGSAVASATVTVKVVDRTNTLNVRSDSFSVPSGSTGNALNVLFNDNILPGNGEALTISSVSVPDHGTAAIVAGGSGLVYSPPAGFVGTARFSYTAADGFGGTGTAQVAVDVGYLTTNPDFFTVLYDDPGKTTDDGTTELDVLKNDRVLLGPAANVTLVAVTPSNPTLGAMSIAPGGQKLRFDPAVSQAGQQLFSYTIEDSSGHRATGTVTVVVLQQGLQANSDYYTVQSESADNELLVLANDVLFKSGGGAMTVIGIGTGPDAPDQGGSVAIAPSGDRLLYSPASGFAGVESFTYVVTDGTVTSTTRVVVRSTVGELAAGADFYLVFRGSTKDENVFQVLGNDVVIPDGGQVLTITAVTNDPANVGNPVNRGELVIGSDLRSLAYAPNPLNNSFPYTETFTYEISDGTARRDSAVLTVQVQDRMGLRDVDTNDDAFTVRTSSAEVTLQVLANDNIRPATAAAWEITSVTSPTSNVCSPFLAADLLDSPALAQKLVAQADPVSLFLWNSFSAATRTLLANAGATVEAKSNALVAELNLIAGGPSIHAPARFAGITLRQQTADLLAANPAGEQLIVLNRLLLEDAYPAELRKSPGGGAVSFNGGVILYTPVPGFTGTERFTYRVSDGLGGTGSGEVTVRVGDVSVSDDRFVILSGSAGNDLDVMANDGILRDAFPTPPLPGAADYTLAAHRGVTVAPAAAGTAVVTGGKVRFTPAVAFSGMAQLTYWAADDAGCAFPATAWVDVQQRGSDRSSAVLSITVTGVNDPPVMLGAAATPLNDKLTTHPFAGVTIRDVDDQLAEPVTVRISFPATRGALSGAFNQTAPGVYEYTGTGAQATAAIRSLVYTPVENRITVAQTEETVFTVSLQDPFVVSPVVNAQSIAQVAAVNDLPVITGTVAGQPVYMHSSIEPFGGVNITDVDDLGLQPLTVTVTIDDAIKGSLSNLGGFIQQAPGVYAITGAPAAVSAALRGLVFNPTPGNRVTPGNPETVRFTIGIADGFAPPVIDAVTTVIVTHALSKKLLPLTSGGTDDSQTGALFGVNVDISGDTIVVGSEQRDGTLVNSGAAFVYERDAGGPGNWGQVARLAPAELLAGDFFGDAVAIDGDIIAVSAALQDPGGLIDSGVVYVYQRDAGNRNVWNQVAKLREPVGDRGESDAFGKSLALHGSTLLVGAPFANRPQLDSGVAFVFEKDQGGPNLWGFTQRLLPAPGPNDGAAQDQFGWAVAVEGNTLAIGAIGANRSGGAGDRDFGAVYVFDRPNAAGTWTQTKKVELFADPASAAGDFFGHDVDLSGNTLAVGASKYDRVVDSTPRENAGAAFVFERNLGGAGNWGLSKKLLSENPAADDLFGASVGISGDLIIVGAPKEELSTNPVSLAGFAHVYRREQGGAENWGLIDTLQPSVSTQNDQFGFVCALDRFTAVVGSATDRINVTNAVRAGAAYVYDFKFNNAPTLAVPIPDQVAPENIAFSFPLPPGTFNDADYGDVLTYAATLSDGSPIPPASWLQFNPATATFFGTPTPANYRPLVLIVTATDLEGAAVQSNVFTISVAIDAKRNLDLLIERWRQQHFSPGALGDPGQEAALWGNNANPDGDPYPNLIEMVFGTDPSVFDLPGLLGVEASPPQITLLYRLDDDFPIECLHVEWSLDLIHWNRINVAQTVRAVLAGAKSMAATAFPPAPSGKIYMRLKIGL